MLRLISGPAGSGKTAGIMARIKQNMQRGEKGSILVAHISVPQEITLALRTQPRVELETVHEAQSMRFEAEAFMDIVNNGKDTAKYDRASLLTARVMDEARRQMGVVFPADAE